MASGFTMLEGGKPGKRMPGWKVIDPDAPKTTVKADRLPPATTSSVKKTKFRKGGMVRGQTRDYCK